jgi:hypothetical protein
MRSREKLREKLSVTVEKRYIALINSSRGLISKSAYVNNILKREFESESREINIGVETET